MLPKTVALYRQRATFAKGTNAEVKQNSARIFLIHQENHNKRKKLALTLFPRMFPFVGKGKVSRFHIYLPFFLVYRQGRAI